MFYLRFWPSCSPFHHHELVNWIKLKSTTQIVTTKQLLWHTEKHCSQKKCNSHLNWTDRMYLKFKNIFKWKQNKQTRKYRIQLGMLCWLWRLFLEWDVCRNTSIDRLRAWALSVCVSTVCETFVYESHRHINKHCAYVLFLVAWTGGRKGQPPLDTHMCATVSLSF